MQSTNVVCLKWGDRYDVEYVNKLYRAVQRTTVGPIDFHCITDCDSGIHEDVICHPLPDEDVTGWWWKLSLFNREFYPSIRGKTLFIDLDMVIVKDLDSLIHYSSDASVVGVFDRVHKDLSSAILLWDRDGDHDLDKLWAKYLLYRGRKDKWWGDQAVICDLIPSRACFPEEWTPSWKFCVKQRGLSEEARVIDFHGKPDPHDLRDNILIKKYWKL